MALELGLQLFTVYDDLRDNFDAGIKRYRDIGYRNMELASFDPGELYGGLPPLKWKGMTGKELKALADGCGVRFISISAPAPNTMPELLEFEFDWEKNAVYNREAGSMGAVYSMMCFRGRDDVMRFAEYMNRAGESSMKAAGLPVFYHNHFHEFQRFGGECAMDLFLDNTDPNYVKMELDTFWALRGGCDPLTYLKKLGKRCPLVHQKDLVKDCVAVDLLAPLQDQTIGMAEFAAAKKPEEFIEVGDGCMDIAGILGLMREFESPYIVVEQDHSKLEPRESARRSYENMIRLMAE